MWNNFKPKKITEAIYAKRRFLLMQILDHMLNSFAQIVRVFMYPIIICSNLGITKASAMIRIVEDIQMNVVNARVVQKDFIWYLWLSINSTLLINVILN